MKLYDSRLAPNPRRVRVFLAEKGAEVATVQADITDITALVGIDFGRISGIRIDPAQKSLQRWHEAVSARPSAAV